MFTSATPAGVRTPGHHKSARDERAAITVVSLAPSEIGLLERRLPSGLPGEHRERLLGQARGEAVYLVAWHRDVPVGHALLRWTGRGGEPAAASRPAGRPEVEDLWVDEAWRERGVASRLLHVAEVRCRHRGYKQLGLDAEAGDTDARALAERRGYRDTGSDPFGEDARTFLVKELVMEESNPSPSPRVPDGEGEKRTMPSTLERGLDLTLGFAILTAEALDQAIQQLVEKGKVAREHAPAIFDTVMEKGRPARENLLRVVRDDVLPGLKKAGGGGSADAEIQTLEDRVATLEQQVSTPTTPDAAAPAAVAAAGMDEESLTETPVPPPNDRETEAPGVAAGTTAATVAAGEVDVPSRDSTLDGNETMAEAATAGPPEVSEEIVVTGYEPDITVPAMDNDAELISSQPGTPEGSGTAERDALTTSADADAEVTEADIEIEDKAVP
uniref:N-acetyltransferase domain-containing protein n=1 Tax=uncultured Armatimonadetes bacterium TaxID=157466 RepID=A0A6J4IJF2_9BACT|nr:hypothetical protein AVDCRST_MAG63-2059 [uncultured Armatimonadetes bacterium]